ncbi:MAG: type III-A CRISPR-associated RAMP protein Csm3 [Epulopiscium sp. Nele67-Bin004]|nr:MAG: type III-A CRISPR-associated RAMP protein Csm3 [Epulopiscium sp. Nele67-Bin004]
MKLKQIKHITGVITLQSGLAIGGNQSAIEIGGNDQPILRMPITGEPYIAGSSIKGKMRMLSEWNLGKVTDGKVHSCANKTCPICRIFGHGSSDDRNNAKVGPTRLIVRDAILTDDSKQKLRQLRETKGQDTELKYENTINRLTSAATPRNKERVPSSIQFELDITYKVLDIDDNGKNDEENFGYVLQALKLVTLDGIGSAVSRGSGAVSMDIYVDGQPVDIDTIQLG